MNPKRVTWVEVVIAAIAVAVFSWWLYPVDVKDENVVPKDEQVVSKKFPEVVLEARSAYVYDAQTGKVLFEKDGELQWPLASLTKLMVALAASKIIPDYLLVRISNDDIHEEGDTGLLIGEEWDINKLIDFSLVVSSNDGIRAIASVAGSQITSTSSTSTMEGLFVERMNKTAKEIGLSETYFLNQSGLDVTPTLSGGYGSAKDMALLVSHILKTNPHILEATSYSKISIGSKNKGHEAQNTNKVLNKIPNVLASKTGYTQLSGGNVVLALNAGIDHPIIISVLGSSYDGRFNDLNALVKATLEYLTP
jgi:serine-type D-Ala-D-Ala carboxypeptidase (penicillin-binding protein 5/6)